MAATNTSDTRRAQQDSQHPAVVGLKLADGLARKIAQNIEALLNKPVGAMSLGKVPAQSKVDTGVLRSALQHADDAWDLASQTAATHPLHPATWDCLLPIAACAGDLRAAITHGADIALLRGAHQKIVEATRQLGDLIGLLTLGP